MKFRPISDKNSVDVDILFFLLLIFLIWKYSFYISMVEVPNWDPSVYLINARNWITDTPIFETFRAPLISWIIAGIWIFTGENWVIIKPLSAIFVIGSGILLYIILRKHKGKLFAFGVVSLTMLNAQVIFYNIQVYTEGLSLFLLMATLYLIKSEDKNHWFLAGIISGLTFASRYYIIIQAITIIILEFLIRKERKILIRALYGMVPIISIVILIMYLKTGTFQIIHPYSYEVTGFMSDFYLINSIEIWGLAFLLIPLVFMFKNTYSDKYNYTFIVWFIVSLLFWSLNISNTQPRYTIQFTPAVYYLSILTIENIINSDIVSILRIKNKTKN